ncbi:cation diffusion facilitator family transporter [Polymorphospora sp. NPDC050346]|uniref:cation diffusion facilitator family transporter n=1 Tax=Polymorphospora sp. NPDC050346 TaxID=3155780 RepID=UPI0033FA40C2
MHHDHTHAPNERTAPDRHGAPAPQGDHKHDRHHDHHQHGDHDRPGDHDHKHDHGGWWGRVRHAATPHSHDSGDVVDPALAASRRGMRVLWWSFAALMVTALAQVAVVIPTASVALLGDTVHNFADALTAVPLAIAFLLGRRVATRRFTYGLGRAEDLAGLFVVLVIAGSAVYAGWEAVDRLLDPRPVRYPGWVALAGLVGFVGNELVARWRIRVGREIGSAALVADGLHARTDGFTSLAVLVGAGGVAVGWWWADPVVGLGITAAIVAVLWSAVREVAGRLLDGVDPAVTAAAERAVTATPGVVRLDGLRLRWVGHTLRAEVEVAVDGGLRVAAAHRIAHDVEHALTHAVPRLTAATVHPHPAGTDHPDRLTLTGSN